MLPLYRDDASLVNNIVQSLLDPVLGVVPTVAAVVGIADGKEKAEKWGVRFLDSGCKEVNMCVRSFDCSVGPSVDHPKVARPIVR